MMSSNNQSEPQKDVLYGEFLRAQRWREQVARRGVLKALDLPDDQMQVHVRKGLGWQELIVLAAVFLGGGGLAAYTLPRLAQPTAPASAARPLGATIHAAPPPPLEGRIRFWIDDDGLRLKSEPLPPSSSSEENADVR